MENIVFDTENDGLLVECTKMHIMNIQDLDSGERLHFLEGDMGWVPLLDNARVVSAHNLCGYDLLVLQKLFNYKLPKRVKQRDTLILSRVLDYLRFGLRGHGLDIWGEALGYPKFKFDEWAVYTPEMLVYCDRDLLINEKVYNILIREFIRMLPNAPYLPDYILAEQAISRWSAIAQWKGWPFDRKAGQLLHGQLEAEINRVTSDLQPRLGRKTVLLDRVPHTGGWRPWKGVTVPAQSYITEPKWTVAGNYHAHLATYFKIAPDIGQLAADVDERTPKGLEDVPFIIGDFCKVAFEERNLASSDDVKMFLYEQGWKPDTWNYKQVGRQRLKTSPKITEDTLEIMGEGGQAYLSYLSASSRFGVLKNWMASSELDGRVHGDCITIGTPSLRARHKTIVNVPSGDAAWGPEMRRLFTCEPGWVLVGCDSAGNQARGLAHYLADAAFTNILLTGDIHTYNAEALDAVLKGMGIDWTAYVLASGVVACDKHTQAENVALRKRGNAKRILYAFLFGAAGAKLWSYIFGTMDSKQGNLLKAGFVDAVPGFSKLLRRLKSEWQSNSRSGGWITSISGAKVYVDSPHKLLVYLLQSCEKATCAGACLLLEGWLEDEDIEYVPLIFMHDELDFMTRVEDSIRARDLGIKAFQEGPKLFGVTIMDGDGKIGEDWYDIH